MDIINFSRTTAFFTIFLASILTGFSSTAIATTPDGETPANEGVCDTLQGGTPGLYGLCVAYCEAQDLDSLNKHPSNTKILSNYRKKMQSGDPDMPCVQTPCDCVTDTELSAMTSDGAASCTRLTSNRIAIYDDGNLNYSEIDTSLGSEKCTYVDVDTSPDTVRFQSISNDNAQSCYTAIDTACSSLGL